MVENKLRKMQPDKKGLVVEVEISSLSLGRPWAHGLHEEWSARVRSEAENRAINLKSRLRTIVSVRYTPIPFSLQLLLSFPLFRAQKSARSLAMTQGKNPKALPLPPK